jgi:uncharacterized protein Yka (UPF0111/DUF47 family)
MRRWFLPETPDLLGLLAHQGDVTVRGMDALCAWSKGDFSQSAALHAIEHEGDLAAREVLIAVKHAFVTPISPEDIYEISERLDAVLNAAKNLVREADLVSMAPDPPMAEMADLVALGVRDLVQAFPGLASDPDRATECADAAVRQERALEHVYRRAMSALLQIHDIREVAGRRELYRRYARMGEAIEGVAHRIWYAVVKEV